MRVLPWPHGTDLVGLGEVDLDALPRQRRRQRPPAGGAAAGDAVARPLARVHFGRFVAGSDSLASCANASRN